MHRICYETVCALIKPYHETGSDESRQGVNYGHQARFNDRQSILDYIAFNPDADGIEISDTVVPELVLSTFYDTLKRMKISYKKTAEYEETDETKRDLFNAKMNKLSPEDLIYYDETGIDNNISVWRGRSAIGERSYGEKPAFKKARLSLIATCNCSSKDLKTFSG